MDYLENTVAKRLEQGIAEKDRLIWEMSDNKEQEKEVIHESDTFSQDEANELEELLKTIIGNKA
jgi:hypothetical protein